MSSFVILNCGTDIVNINNILYVTIDKVITCDKHFIIPQNYSEFDIKTNYDILKEYDHFIELNEYLINKDKIISILHHPFYNKDNNNQLTNYITIYLNEKKININNLNLNIDDLMNLLSNNNNSLLK